MGWGGVDLLGFGFRLGWIKQNQKKREGVDGKLSWVGFGLWVGMDKTEPKKGRGLIKVGLGLVEQG